MIASRAEPLRRGVVFYSLGSLTKPLNYPAYALAGIASVEIAIGTDGRPTIEAAEIVPVVQLVERMGDGSRACIEPLASLCNSDDRDVAAFAEEAARFADRVLGREWRKPCGRDVATMANVPGARRRA